MFEKIMDLMNIVVPQTICSRKINVTETLQDIRCLIEHDKEIKNGVQGVLPNFDY